MSTSVNVTISVTIAHDVAKASHEHEIVAAAYRGMQQALRDYVAALPARRPTDERAR